MFMPSTLKNFDKLAGEVVDEFLTASVPLKESIVKVANREELNPEEVKRLVEMANTSATIKLIKVATDGSLEFDMADSKEVLQATHPEGAPTEKVAMPSTTQVPSTMPNTLDKVDVFNVAFGQYKTEKVASVKPASIKKVFMLKTEAEELGVKKVAAELAFKKAADTLLSDFSDLYGPDFSKFASEAYTLYGETALPMLDALASDIRQPKEFNKVAYIIDDINDKQLKLFKVAHTAISDVCRLTKDITIKKEQVAEAWKELKHLKG